MWDSFWDFVWYTLVIFAFVAYLLILWNIIGDLFSNRQMSGGKKAIWVVFLILVPYLAAIVYLVLHGEGMIERQRAGAAQIQRAEDEYSKYLAAPVTPTQEIAAGKKLLDDGAISPQEFEILKQRVLG